MSERIHTKKRGAPVGNQNARKHGYYSNVLTPRQQENLAAAANLRGVDKEIAIFRVKISSILANDPDNINVLAMAMVSLARLVRTQHDPRQSGSPNPEGH